MWQQSRKECIRAEVTANKALDRMTRSAVCRVLQICVVVPALSSSVSLIIRQQSHAVNEFDRETFVSVLGERLCASSACPLRFACSTWPFRSLGGSAKTGVLECRAATGVRQVADWTRFVDSEARHMNCANERAGVDADWARSIPAIPAAVPPIILLTTPESC